MNSSFKNAPHENNFKAFRRESGRQSNLKLERNLYNRVQATSVDHNIFTNHPTVTLLNLVVQLVPKTIPNNSDAFHLKFCAKILLYTNTVL